tara:strand:- start:805 stop:2652 length:1848 start_codon:yes stop_codon:yes gene_type:complete
MQKLKIALVNMPFGFHIYPSIQLGTLSSLMKAHGWSPDCHYLNLQFAHQLGLPVYNQLCEERNLIGEWLFSEVLFGNAQNNQKYSDRYAGQLERLTQSLNAPKNFLLEVKTKMVPDFLSWAVDFVDWGQYDLVGFTSTFNQNIASLTLAKLVKEKHSSVKTLFGGSNFDSEMGLEYCRAFDWIDFAILGEAENILPPFLESLETGVQIPKGVAYRLDGKIHYEENHNKTRDFTASGLPDYQGYFEQLRQIDPHSPLLENPIVLYETARGCWWGEKHHCTFCGLNASTMEFRAKAVEQVKDEIAKLSHAHDTFRFRIVDNILEMKYIEEVFGGFALENYDMQFFIEVKSNLTREQIKTLSRGGVNVIQPGIESFSVNQLREMDKGVRPIQNILCLKWSMYYGIDCEWNILTGFPGETDQDYWEQIELLQSLVHLQPPIGVGDLYLERFSPYFTNPEEYGVTVTGPGEAYRYVYDGDSVDLMKIAYDFEFESTAQIDLQLKSKLHKVAGRWKERHNSEQIPFLFFTKSVDFLTIYDGRSEGEPTKTRFEGNYAKILIFCNESARSLDQIYKHLEKNGTNPSELHSVEGVLTELTERKILYGERGKYLTLALPHNSNL